LPNAYGNPEMCWNKNWEEKLKPSLCPAEGGIVRWFARAQRLVTGASIHPIRGCSAKDAVYSRSDAIWLGGLPESRNSETGSVLRVGHCIRTEYGMRLREP
jgi:hypothetical protein